MKTLNENDSLLLIIDIQEKLLNAVFNKEEVEVKSNILVKAANILGIPIIITEQYPKGLGVTINSILSEIQDVSKIYEKDYFSALRNEKIANSVKNMNKKQILICGIETHICVSQTVIDLIAQGYKVYVAKDACGSRSEVEYKAGLEYMNTNGANIITTEIALFEWLKTSTHKSFKEIQRLIK